MILANRFDQDASNFQLLQIEGDERRQVRPVAGGDDHGIRLCHPLGIQELLICRVPQNCIGTDVFDRLNLVFV